MTGFRTTVAGRDLEACDPSTEPLNKVSPEHLGLRHDTGRPEVTNEATAETAFGASTVMPAMQQL